jgi:hypothetical protein
VLRLEFSIECSQRISFRKLWQAIKLIAIIVSTYLVSNGVLPNAYNPTTWHERGAIVRSASALSHEIIAFHAVRGPVASLTNTEYPEPTLVCSVLADTGRANRCLAR